MTKEEREAIAKVIATATKEVAAMPEWKRNILRDSAEPMRSTPRKPVINL